MEFKIGIRPSTLALKQAEEVVVFLKKRFPKARFSFVKIATPGDRDKVTPLSEVEGSDFFTRDIDEALISGKIDFAVHSAKDLPDVLPQGLSVFVETQPLSPFDALVSKGNIKLAVLAQASRIGVSSARRKLRIKVLRPDLIIVDVRGTIEERLRLIDDGKIDALIVAHAALIRLGLEKRASEILPLEIFKAHPKQGRLAILTRKEYEKG